MIDGFIPGIVDDRGDLPKVEARAVAFLDILGFRELSQALLSSPGQLNALDYQVRFAERLLKGDLGIARGTDVRLFSDCICVSVPAEPEYLVRLLFTLEHLQLRLACAGVFIRGGLAVGEHFQTDRTTVSAGLIAAYELESAIAVMPRIAVHESFIDVISPLDEDQWVNPWRNASISRQELAPMDRIEHKSGLHILADAEDNVRYLHYMADLYSVDDGRLLRDYVCDHKYAILRWIDQGRSSTLTSRIVAKHEWLVDYHNASADEIWGADCPCRIEPDEMSWRSI